MGRTYPQLLALLVLIACLGSPAAAAALPLSPSLSALPATPALITVSEGASAAYRVDVQTGEILTLSLLPDISAPSTLDLDVYVYGPSASETNHALALAASAGPVTMYPESVSLQAPESGIYYVEVHSSEQTGSGLLTWSVHPEPPLHVYRFYNRRTGTHFYTSDEAEKAAVINTLGSVFTLEGVAYFTKPSRNDQALHRFHNKQTGTHFYTADESEKNRIIQTLGHLYGYDGPGFSVSRSADGGKAPVYRFYNDRAGTHFYTADEDERARVQSTLGYRYTFEGIAFYLGQ